ncbi:MAG: hypothetical protein ACR2GY_12395 [Phycisphaerales bacterium]
MTGTIITVIIFIGWSLVQLALAASEKKKQQQRKAKAMQPPPEQAVAQPYQPRSLVSHTSEHESRQSSTATRSDRISPLDALAKRRQQQLEELSRRNQAQRDNLRVPPQRQPPTPDPPSGRAVPAPFRGSMPGSSSSSSDRSSKRQRRLEREVAKQRQQQHPQRSSAPPPTMRDPAIRDTGESNTQRLVADSSPLPIEKMISHSLDTVAPAMTVIKRQSTSTSSNSVRERLGLTDRAGLRNAMILREVFDVPVSMRQVDPSDR